MKDCQGCAGRILKGIKGQAKARLGIGLATNEEIDRRRAVCRGCENAIPCGSGSNLKCVCRVCGCRLKEKTMLAVEKCPLDPPLWDSVD